MIKPAITPISSANLQPEEPQRDRVIEAEQKTDLQLSAHETGNRSIDVARDLAHVVTMRTGTQLSKTSSIGCQSRIR